MKSLIMRKRPYYLTIAATVLCLSGPVSTMAASVIGGDLVPGGIVRNNMIARGYTAKHPDMIRLEAEIAQLEETKRQLQSGADSERVAREEAQRRLDVLWFGRVAIVGGLLLALSLALFAPYHLNYITPYSEFKLWTGFRTPPSAYVTVHGIFLFALLSSTALGVAILYLRRMAILRYEAQLRETRRAREAAEAADRVKALFLATMSHEVRTPMNGILATTDLLQQTPLTSRQRELTRVIDQSGRSLLDLARQHRTRRVTEHRRWMAGCCVHGRKRVQHIDQTRRRENARWRSSRLRSSARS